MRVFVVFECLLCSGKPQSDIRLQTTGLNLIMIFMNSISELATEIIFATLTHGGHDSETMPAVPKRRIQQCGNANSGRSAGGGVCSQDDRRD